MRNWPEVALSDCARIVGGATPDTTNANYWGGDIYWVTPKDLSGLSSHYITGTPRTITQEGLASCAAEVLPANSVLFSSRAPIGHTAINLVPVATNQGFKSLVADPERLNPKFLLHWLRFNRALLEGIGTGATFKEVSKAVVSRIKMLLPPLPEQRRIAAILDQADALRVKRRQAISQTDSLPESLFSQMFGDPSDGVMSRDSIRLGDILEKIESGESPVCLDRPAFDGEWGVLKLGAVTWCEYNSSQNKALPTSVTPNREIEVKAGDLLFTRKNTHDLVAACALVKETRPNLLLPDLIFRLRMKTDSPVRAEYLHRVLISPKKRQQIQSLAGGSAGSMPNISKTRLLTVEIPVASMSQQAEFARLLESIARNKSSQVASLAKLDTLFQSLQHRAFRGEL